MKAYYQLSGEEVLREVNGSEEPLTKEQISENQKKYGPNELTEGKKKTTFQIFLEQYKDFLVIILIIAAIASGFMGDIESAAVIVIVITMNAILGTVQTVKAESSLASLKKLSGPEAKVLRDGVVVPIPSSEVTVGDIIMLEAGDYIPADGRILECASMKVDESALTGESLGVEKTTDVIEQDEVPLGDRINMVYSGSFLTYGRGSFVVTEIGMNTEVGKIASLLKTTSEKKTPLQVNLDQFGQKLSILILVFCAILFGISVFRGENIGNAFLFAVALAVAAIPEALSSIVTIVLSFGTQKMAKEHAIVRKLQAVEGLGSVSIICSDKTGTLTQNKMTVEHYYVDGQSISADKIDLRDLSQSRLLISSILCNDSTNIDGVEIGDPTETALINLGSSLGLDPEEVRVKYPRESENPFDSDRKMMATKHSLNGVPTMIVKGAVDVLLNRTDWVEMKGETHEITEETRRVIEEQNQKYSREGLRVLAFAYKEVSDETELTLEDEDHLIFLGLIAMMDPPREESKAAVEECKCAGIRPIMITGDHKVTAAAIAKRIGILENESEACEGAEIDKMSDEELKELAKEELSESKKRVEELEHELKILLLPKDPNDDKNVIVEIRAGAGGDEAALFAAEIYRMYLHYAEGRRWKVEMISLNENGIGGFKECVFMITGQGAYSRLKYESGVHRVQRVPETESGGGIHTSTITVAIMPEAEDVDVVIDDKDIRIDVMRASGNGGQCVNTTDSAVRLTHYPTGIVIYSQTEKSQLQNKEKAFRLLRSKLYDLEMEKKQASEAEARRSQIGTGDRSEKIRTYNFPQGRVTDHRIKLTLHKLDSILNGDLDEIIDSLTAADQAAKLANMNEE